MHFKKKNVKQKVEYQVNGGKKELFLFLSFTQTLTHIVGKATSALFLLTDLSRTDGHLAVPSTRAILPPAGAGPRGPRVPRGGNVVQAVAGFAVTRRTHVAALTPVLDAAHGEPETRARAQVAPGRVLVGIHRGGGAVTAEEKCRQRHEKQAHCDQEGAPNCFDALRSCLTFHREG